jgi:hypothetical protein
MNPSPFVFNGCTVPLAAAPKTKVAQPVTTTQQPGAINYGLGSSLL